MRGGYGIPRWHTLLIVASRLMYNGVPHCSRRKEPEMTSQISRALLAGLTVIVAVFLALTVFVNVL